jgi:hypothetical protein
MDVQVAKTVMHAEPRSDKKGILEGPPQEWIVFATKGGKMSGESKFRNGRRIK